MGVTQTPLIDPKNMPPEAVERLLARLKNRRADTVKPECNGFMAYVRAMWPAFRQGRFHPALANAFERIAEGRLKRLMVNMPPRHGKSEFCSVQLPSWYIGRFPDRKLMHATHTEKLTVTFGRRIKNQLQDPDFQAIFPGCQLAKDSKSSKQFATLEGGEYFAAGVGSNLAGRGAHLMLIDDPHSEQDVLANPELTFQKAYDWYQTGPRQRLQPGAAIVINATRWGRRDLCGRLLADAKTDPLGDQWEVLSLPAILADGQPLFPEFWPLRELELLRRTLPPQRWNAQYQQNPLSVESAIVKPEWWKPWTRRLPKLEFTCQSWDTSFGEYSKGNPSACVLMGVFRPRKEPGFGALSPPYGVILLDAWEGRVGFPELKQRALEFYRAAQPDSLAIEARSAGEPLIQEFRRMGLPVARYAPSRGSDKTTRLNSVADLFQSGLVWYTDTPLAQRVIQQFAEHPDGEADDLMDATIQALIRIREGGFVRLDSDAYGEDEDEAEERAFERAARVPVGGYY